MIRGKKLDKGTWIIENLPSTVILVFFQNDKILKPLPVKILSEIKTISIFDLFTLESVVPISF
jgi:hypothetical protein